MKAGNDFSVPAISKTLMWMLEWTTLHLPSSSLAWPLLLIWGQRLFGGGWNLKGNIASLEISMKAAVAAAVAELESKQRR